MAEKILTCIGCPMGCELTENYTEGDADSVVVTGNTCEKGRIYGTNEVISPKRTVTGTVNVVNREGTVVSVKTVPEIPKDMVIPVSEELNNLYVEAPTHIGDVVVRDILGTGSDLLITKNII